MRRFYPENKKLYRLWDYAIAENEDGTYEYIAWDFKNKKPMWFKGQAEVLGDVLALTEIASYGEDKNVKKLLEVKWELYGLPTWDKTKFYCALMQDRTAIMVSYCRTNVTLHDKGKEFGVVKEMLKQHGVTLR